MAIAYPLARRFPTIVALLCVAPTILARPLLVAPKRVDVPPLIESQYPNQYPTAYGQPAIDGDTLIVGASRIVDGTYARRDGVFLFERDAAGHWNYVRPLLDGIGGNPLLNGNLAVIQSYETLRIYERGAQGWSLTDTLSLDAGTWNAADHVFRIDDGSLYVERNDWVFPPRECQPPYQQWRKVNGV